jgi:2,4-dichlorophenol 6-monooxygenase
MGEQSRVLVIGGGPVGLVVAGLLARFGVASLVVERRRDTVRAPAAHVLRRRSLEVLALLGVDDEVRRAAPHLPLDFITWCTTLGGTEVGRLDLRPPDPETGERGPEPWTNCPQNLLEPILLRNVLRRPEVQVERGAECVAVEQTASGVTACIRSGDGRERRVAAAWAIAADGASSPTRKALGIPMVGQGALGRFLMTHFAADLTPWISARPGPIFWILNPEAPACLIVHDPARSHVLMTLADDSAEPAAAVPRRLAAALGVPARPRILSVDAWSPHVQVAARYRQGRVLLVGDAAHRFPPTGGLGLNTGIQEAHALASTLARVETGRASPALLDDYEAECRPVAEANAAASFANLERLAEVSRVVGTCPSLASLEQRLASMTATEREALAAAIESQRGHFLCDGARPGAVAGGVATRASG